MNTKGHLQILAEFAEKFPPLLNVEQAAQIAAVPVKTIYYWSSLGHLDACKHTRGKHVRFTRDCFVNFLLGTNTSTAAA